MPEQVTYGMKKRVRQNHEIPILYTVDTVFSRQETNTNEIVTDP